MNTILSEQTLFEQITSITKAHAYDILAEQCKKLESENIYLKARVANLENLIKEYTEKMLSTLK